jgi:predicted O-methyltransferase YrrM
MLAAVIKTGGLISPCDALALYRLARLQDDGARILEIGSFRGASTTAIGHAIKNRDIELYCLDCWDDYYGQGFFERSPTDKAPSDFEIFRDFITNTTFVKNQLRIMKGSSSQFKNLLANGFFNLIFIDAAHDYDNVVQDINIAFKALLPGGIICGHDYHSDGHGVIEAVNDIIAFNPRIIVKGLITGTSIWYALPQE